MKRGMVTAWIIALSGALLFWQSSARVCGSEPVVAGQDTNSTILVRVEQFSDYMCYSGTTLTPMICVHVFCRRNDSENMSEPVPYEDLWYRGCDFIGYRRFGQLPVAPHETVDMEVSFAKLPSSSESAGAASNAAARLLLDCSLNFDSLAQVIVPAEQYSSIAEQLVREGFAPYATVFRTAPATIPLNLRATDGRRTTFLYAKLR